MAVILPAAVADRLVKLLGMLGSVHDGEALTAARMADRLLRHQLKLTWGEVVQPLPTRASGPEPPRVWHEPGTWQEAARLAAQRLKTYRRRSALGSDGESALLDSP